MYTYIYIYLCVCGHVYIYTDGHYPTFLAPFISPINPKPSQPRVTAVQRSAHLPLDGGFLSLGGLPQVATDKASAGIAAIATIRARFRS